MNETKLTLKTIINDKVTEATIVNDRWDMDIYEMVDMFKSLLLAAGWSPDNIKEILKDE
jgi:hypothetical protein